VTAKRGKYFFQLMYFLHKPTVSSSPEKRHPRKKSPKTLRGITGMSALDQWPLDCSMQGGARDKGDGNITSCSRFSVTVVRTVAGNKGDAVFPRCVASFFLLPASMTLSIAPGLTLPRSQAKALATFTTKPAKALLQCFEAAVSMRSTRWRSSTSEQSGRPSFSHRADASRMYSAFPLPSFLSSNFASRTYHVIASTEYGFRSGRSDSALSLSSSEM
jgi:hypothetical protein